MFVGFHFITHRPDKQRGAWKWGVLCDLMTFAFILNYILLIVFRVDIDLRFSDDLLEDRMYCGVTPRLAVPFFCLYMYSLAVGRGLMCRLCSSRLLVRLSPASYAIYLLHQPVFEWWSIAHHGEWWTKRKAFEWFSPDPIVLDWAESIIVISLTTLLAIWMTWLIDTHLMARWLAFVRWITCRKDSSGGQGSSAQEVVLSAIEDLVGIRPSLDDSPSEMLASLGVVALVGSIASRDPAIKLPPAEVIYCETVRDVVEAATAARKSASMAGDKPRLGMRARLKIMKAQVANYLREVYGGPRGRMVPKSGQIYADAV